MGAPRVAQILQKSREQVEHTFQHPSHREWCLSVLIFSLQELVASSGREP